MQKKVRGTETEDGEEGGWRTEMQEKEKGRRGETQKMWVQGGTEGDSGKKALKWVRGEDDDVEERKKGIVVEEAKGGMSRQDG